VFYSAVHAGAVMNECILEMKGISVRFPGVLALNNASLEARSGEVTVLLGENGAGKSTMVKIIAGVNNDYTGTVLFKGNEIVCRSIHEQQKRGISMIFQEMSLLKNMTVAENISIGNYLVKRSGTIDWKSVAQKAKGLLDSIGSDIPENRMVKELTIGQMQMVEIAKALSSNADVIIMDEPTSALTKKEVDSLFKVIENLKKKGVAIIYISHRMEEIMKIGDRITVFKDGQFIKALRKDETDLNELIRLMVGREVTEYYHRIDTKPGHKILEVNNLSGEKFKDVSFYVREGEITGFYGLMGAGRTELMRAIYGADKYSRGEIKVNGYNVHIASCYKAKKNKLALLPEDRKIQGLIQEFDISKNITLTHIEKTMNRFGINGKKELRINQKLIEATGVKTPSLEQKVRNLSGGNQQKVCVSKWLNADANVFIFDEPTRGIDVGAKIEIYNIMNSLKSQDKAVIMISSELTEAMNMSDRLYVMLNGGIVACIESKELRASTEADILKYAIGADPGSGES
jgi:ABC-type sugar transport system ATPase subunit